MNSIFNIAFRSLSDFRILFKYVHYDGNREDLKIQVRMSCLFISLASKMGSFLFYFENASVHLKADFVLCTYIECLRESLRILPSYNGS